MIVIQSPLCLNNHYPHSYDWFMVGDLDNPQKDHELSGYFRAICTHRIDTYTNSADTVCGIPGNITRRTNSSDTVRPMSFTDMFIQSVQDPLAQLACGDKVCAAGCRTKAGIHHFLSDHKDQKSVRKNSVFMSDTFRTTKYWMKHDSAWDRRHLNKEFRLKEKQYFRCFGEFLQKCKSRGWKTW